MKKTTAKVILLKTKKSAAPKTDRVKSSKPAPIYDLKVTLIDSGPVIWRRILIAGDANLGFLHAVLQIAMGWTNSHLHQFEDSNSRYTDPGLDEDSIDDANPPFSEFEFLVSDVLLEKGALLQYLYDFGDSWDHLIEVENIMKESSPYNGYPVCVDGARACPPEDCGGIHGYSDLCDIMEDPENEEYEETLEWLGGSFNPDAFNIKETNRYLKKLKWKNPTWEHLVGIMEERFKY